MSYLTLPYYTTTRWSIRNFGNDFEKDPPVETGSMSSTSAFIYIDLPSSEKCPPHNYMGDWEIIGGGSCCVNCDETDTSNRQS